MKKIVGVLGPKGTNGHGAASRLLHPLEDYEVRFFASHAEILERVRAKEIDFGVVPIHNTSTGLISDTRAFWLGQNGDFDARGVYPALELSLPIDHCLAVHPQAEEGKPPTAVYSHSEALEQCRKAIKELGACQEKATLSTAEAARLVAESGGQNGSAAIVSAFAAEIYGLRILRRNIQDNDGNETAFHLIGQKKTRATSGCKTAVIFWLKNETRALVNALSIISAPGRNMFILDTIFSGDRNNIAFYLEFEGHRDEKNTAAILTLLESSVNKLVVLGSFPELI